MLDWGFEAGIGHGAWSTEKEARRVKTEDRGKTQKSEIRGQKSEVRGQTTDDRGQNLGLRISNNV